MLGRGIVDRSRSPVDRRRQDLLPTVIGRQLVAEVVGLQKRHLRRVFRRAGPAEVAGFQNVLLVAAQHAARARQATLSGAAWPRPANPPSPVDLPGAFEDGHR